MNLRSLINFNESLNTAVGINVHSSDSSGVRFSFCVLKMENHLLNVMEYDADLDSIEQVREKLKNYATIGTRIHFNFSGKGVLIKPAETTSLEVDHSLVEKLFPFIKKDDVVSQTFKNSKGGFLAVTRKELVTPMENMSQSGHLCYAYSLGPFILESIASLLASNQLVINGYKIEVENHEIKKVSDNGETLQDLKTIQAGDQQIGLDWALAYAAACSVFLPNTSIATSSTPITLHAREGFLTRSQLYKVAKVAMIATLAVLVINSIAFFWLDSEKSELESRVSVVSNRTEEDQAKQSKLTELTQAYNSLGWKYNILPLYYADQIGQTIPTDIQLVLLEVGVLNNARGRQEKEVSIMSDIIKIKGLSNNPVSLNEWTKKIENLNWVGNITDQEYKFDATKGKGVFELNIHIK